MSFVDNPLFNKFLSNHVLKFIGAGVNFLLIALIARTTNPDILGEFTTVYALTILISSLAFWGMSDGLILLKVHFKLNELILYSLIIIFINGMISFLLILLNFQNFYLYTNLFMAFTVISILFINLYSSILRILGKYTASIYFNSIQDKIICILSLIYFYFKNGELSIINVLNCYFFSLIISFFICVSFSIYFYKKTIGVSKYKIKNFSKISFIYKHNSPLVISDLVNNFAGTIDILILNNFLPYSQIASYKVASAFAKLVKISLSSFSNYMLPELTLMIQNKSQKTKDYITNNYNYIFLSTIIITLFIALFGETIIISVYGVDYTESFSFLLILLIGFSYNNLSGPNGTILLSFNKKQLLLKIDVISALFGTVLLYVFTMFFSVWGSIIANVLMLLLYNSLKSIFVINEISYYQIILRKIFNYWLILSILILLIFFYYV